jgi:Tol biopolymer transport system component
MTETGMSLGTPTYMSPEQAMGEREIGPQSDVYALGAVMYEMLTGEPPFTGPTAQSIVAKVLTEEPRPLGPKRHTIPANVESAVLTALEKLPADRFASAAEFSDALHGATVPTRSGTRAVPTRQGSRSRLLLVVAAITAIAVLLGTAMLFRKAPAPAPLRASLLAPPGCEFGEVANNNLIQVSPDGSMVAFVATCGGGPVLWVRSMVTGEARKLKGSDNVLYPFWAPNSRSLGFFADTKLKRVDLETGAVQDLATVVAGRGGSWGTKDVIVYAPDIAGPLYQVPATGGVPAVIGAVPSDSQKIVTYRDPQFLPDGEHFLFARGTAAGTSDAGTTRIGKLGSSADKVLLNFASNTAYADGRLLFGRNNLLLSQPFDPSSGRLSGLPVSVLPGLEAWTFRFLTNFSVSEDGRVLVYRTEPTPQNRVEWFDPRTGASSLVLEAGPYKSIRISPDGRKLLIERSAPDNPLVDAWTYDIETRGWGRLTSRPLVYYDLAWSPDGKRIAYDNSADSIAYIVTLDHSSSQSIADSVFVNTSMVQDWSPDGNFLVGWQQVKSTGFDLIVKPLNPLAESHILYATPADETSPRISRDGRFLSYVSNQTGRYEVFVTRMPGATAHWQVSQDGVSVPGGFRIAESWGPGGLLYFANPSHQLMVATIGDGGAIGKAALVRGAPQNIVGLDAAPDGRLVLLRSEATHQVPLSLIEHWTGLLKQQ